MNGEEGELCSWWCAVCAAENGTDSLARCWACGRARPVIDWPRRLRRIGAIVFGIALQVGAGILIWLFPPGGSPLSWAVYILMGIVGFLHIFIGGEMLRRDLRSAKKEERHDPVFTAAMLPHPTGEPATLSPNEMRTSGAAIVVALIAISIATCAALWMLGGP